MKYPKYLALFCVIFFSVLGGYLLSYANFAQKIPENLISKNEVYAKEDSNSSAFKNPNFTQLQEVFRAVPAKILPSVVQLNVSSVQKNNSLGLKNFYYFFGEEPPEEKRSPQEYRRTGLGSGSIIRKKNNTYYVLTNNHVIKDAVDIEIIMHTGDRFSAEIVGGDSRVDLAVVKFEPDKDIEITIADLGNSDNLKIGDLVMAIGSPDGFQSTVTQGIVSYMGRRGGPGGNINDFIQTDASINKGNSGGPLVNMNGEIIGINTWIASESGTSAGLGFAIPINNVKFVVNSFLEKGKLSYGWLGVTLHDYRKQITQLVGKELAKEIFTPMKIYEKQGSFISDVYKDSPADKGGIMPGDFVIELNGKLIESSDELTFEIGMLRPKQKINLRLLRNGKEKRVSVTLGERQPEEKLAKGLDNNWPGLIVMPINKKINERLKKVISSPLVGVENSGLMVLNVVKDSPIQIVGLKAWDVITKINGRKVNNLLEFYRELNKNSTKDTIFSYKRKGYELDTPKIKLK